MWVAIPTIAINETEYIPPYQLKGWSYQGEFKKFALKEPENFKLIAQLSEENGLDPKYTVAVAICESGLNETMQSKFIQPYGREQSFGLFQIHTRAHKNVTIEQAKDPYFNTNWALEHIKKGKAKSMWVTCHKKAMRV